MFHLYLPHSPAVVAMGTAEAAAAAAPTDGDSGGADVTWRRRRGRQRAGGPPAPVPYSVLPGLHLSDSA